MIICNSVQSVIVSEVYVEKNLKKFINTHTESRLYDMTLGTVKLYTLQFFVYFKYSHRTLKLYSEYVFEILYK